MSAPADTVHASCVAIAGRGILIEGRSGSGKSDLALRLIDRGAMLVSDDRTVLVADGERLVASAPLTIAGQLEVRGLGILALPASPPVPVSLWIELVAEPDRMPPDPLPERSHAGCRVPLIALAALHASTPIKVEQALVRFGRAR